MNAQSAAASLSELALETLFPADDLTAARMRHMAANLR
jgi:hypothetical protein